MLQFAGVSTIAMAYYSRTRYQTLQIQRCVAGNAFTLQQHSRWKVSLDTTLARSSGPQASKINLTIT